MTELSKSPLAKPLDAAAPAPTTRSASTDNKQPDNSIHGPKRIGLLIFFLVFGVFGVWASVAPIQGAALGSGTVVVRSNRQVVQHFEGGIVRDIRVRNGDLVQAGDILMVLDSTQPLSQLELTVVQLNAYLAREARLIAERDNLDEINFPAQLLSVESGQVLEEVSIQRHLFHTRRASLQGAVEVLEQRIGQLQSRLNGLRAQRDSKLTLAASYREELSDVELLLAEGFSDRNRLRELQRNVETLRGEAAELESTISTTEIQIGETRLEILQQSRQFQNEVAEELSEVQTLIKDAEERITALRDVVSRTTIRAPVSGAVNGMQVHTIGGVISPGMEIADVVPQGDELVVEARISPVDIDRVTVGQEATIRFSAFGSAVPSIFGEVIHVSADSFTDPNTGAPYYTARVEVTPDGMDNLGDLILVPGMPADVFISTGARTLLQYMLKPVTTALAKSFIED